MPLNKHLKINSRGDAVAELHDALRILAPGMPAAEPSSPHLEMLFAREVSAKRFGKATKSILTKIQRSNGLIETGEADDPTRAFLEQVLGAVDDGGVPRPAPPSKAKNGAAAKVSGMIMDAAGRPLAGVEVTLEALTAGAASQLSQGFTDKEGAYTLNFDAGARGTAPAIRIAARTSSGETFRSTALLHPPREVEGFNVVAPRMVSGGEFETDYERDIRLLTEAAGDVAKLIDLTETEDDPQASLLSAQTGIPAERVALVAAALRLSRESAGAVPAELAYALGAAGVAFGSSALAKLPRERLATAIKEAIAAGHAPEGVLDGLDAAIESARDALRASGVRAIEKADLGQILRDAFEETEADDAPRTRRFLKIMAAHEGDRRSFWKALKDDPKIRNKDIEQLAFRLPAAIVTGGNPRAVEMLCDLKETNDWKDLSSLCAWTHQEWAENLKHYKVPLPRGVSDDTSDPQAYQRYARGIDFLVEALYPTAYLIDRISTSKALHNEKIEEFLKEIGKRAFHACNLHSLLAEKADAAKKIDPSEKEQLHALHRVIRITRRATPAIRLLEEGVNSARSIAAQGPKAFARKYGEAFGGAEIALRAHSAARSTSFSATELWWASLGDFVDADIAALSGESSAATEAAGETEETPGEAITLPDWPTLFGAEDSCACRHCRSATSPGAYLVDVLEFLRARSAGAESAFETALEVLKAPTRRPDLVDLELTCENAETVLPYIDLVIEALENTVAPLPVFAAANIGDDLDLRAGENSDRIGPELRDALNRSLEFDKPSNRDFAVGKEAQIVSLTEGRPWRNAPRRWRVDDRLASYTLAERKDVSKTKLRVESRSRSTRGSTSDRLARPQYENRAAYATLAKATYPWTLPFERPRETVRAGLGAIGRELADTLEQFSSGPEYERRRRKDVALERLGLSPVDASLVVWAKTSDESDGFNPEKPWEIWGFRGGPYVMKLDGVPDPENIERTVFGDDWYNLLASRLDVLLDRGQLTVRQLLALLDTDYVNPPPTDDGGAASDGRAISIVSKIEEDPATCHSSDLELTGVDRAGGWAIRMARMARLSMRSGVSYREIDQAMQTLAASDLDENFLKHLGQLKALRARLGVRWDALCATFVPAGPWTARLQRLPNGVTEEMLTSSTNGALSFDSVIEKDLLAVRVLTALERKGLRAASNETDWTRALDQLFAAQDRLRSYWSPVGASRHVDHSETETRLSETLYEALFKPDRDAEGPRMPADPAELYGFEFAECANECAAAFGVPVSDILEIIGSGFVLQKSADGEKVREASICSLARLHRHAELMRRLGLQPRDYVNALRLWNADPFAEPAALADFVAAIDQLAVSALSISDLTQLCLGEGDEGAPEDADTALLATLREALAAVAAENVFVPADAADATPTVDPDGALLASRLAAIGMPTDIVNEVVEVLSESKVHEERMEATLGAPIATGPKGEIDLPTESELDELPEIDGLEGSGQKIDLNRYTDEPGTLEFKNATGVQPGKLKAIRKLRPAERAALLAASTNEAWKKSLTLLFKEQDRNAGEATYDSTSHTLSFKGVMSNKWYDHLESLNRRKAWKDCVESLRNRPATIVRAKLKALRPKMPLEPLQVPPELESDRGFVDDFEELPIWTDVSATGGQHALIRALLPEEIDQLTRLATPGSDEDTDELRSFRKSLTRYGGALPILNAKSVEGIISIIDPATPYTSLLRHLSPIISGILLKNAMYVHVAAMLRLPKETMEWLASKSPETVDAGRAITDILTDSVFVHSEVTQPPTKTAFGSQHKALQWLRRAALLLTRLEMTTADLEFLAKIENWPALEDLPTAPVGVDRASTFPIRSAMAYARYARIREKTPYGRAALATLAGILYAESGELRRMAADRHDISADEISSLSNEKLRLEKLRLIVFTTETARLLGVPVTEIEQLIGPDLLGLSSGTDVDRAAFLTLPEEFPPEPGLFRMVHAIEALVRTGLGANTIAKLTNAPLGLDAGNAVTTAIARGMDPSQWREQGKAIQDKIRARSRDALLAYLLAHGRKNDDGSISRWRNPAELTGHLLIDVEMGACMETSRLKQAMSSLQMFVQRCRLGLEPDVCADPEQDDGWSQWDWMRTYRVWEANKKGFLLFPENLLKPEFMDMKSFQFRELEGALGQGEVTNETATRAMLGYLHGLKEVANLEPISVVEAMEGDRKVLHVVGASRGEPRKLYYRRREDTGVWLPWEPINLEIQSRHVLLHVHRGRVFLYWLNIQSTATDNASDRIKLEERSEVTLCWSELSADGWAAQRQSSEKINIPNTDASGVSYSEFTKTRMALCIQENYPEILLWLWLPWEQVATPWEIAPYFRVPYPNAVPSVEWGEIFELPTPVDGAERTSSGQRIYRSHSSDWNLFLPSGSGTSRAFTVIGSAQIVGDRRLSKKAFQRYPFIFADSARAFLVSSRYQPYRVLPEYPFAAEVLDDATLAGSRGEHLRFWDIMTPMLAEMRSAKGPPIDPAVLFCIAGLATDEEARVGSVPVRLASVLAVSQGFRKARNSASTQLSQGREEIQRRNLARSGSVFQDMGLDLTFAQPSPEAKPLNLTEWEGGDLQLGANANAVQLLSAQSFGWIDQSRATRSALIAGQRVYSFQANYHPYADKLIDAFGERGMFKMLGRELQLRPYASCASALPSIEPEVDAPSTYADIYASNDKVVEAWKPRTENLDFDHDGAYSAYNWELFYHIPMLITDRLANSERYADALKWLNTIFDPTDQTQALRLPWEDKPRQLGPERAWQTKPLLLNSLPEADGSTRTARERIERLLRLYAAKAAHEANSELAPQPLSEDEEADLESFKAQVEEVRRNPFRPYAVARLRTTTFQRAVVMKYVEVLLRWGDRLFRRDTMETVNEATQLYLMAASFRGRKAATMPPRAIAAPQTYATLKDRLDGSGNALVAIEGFVTPHASAAATVSSEGEAPPPPSMLAFCIPRNEKLDRLWNDIGDRLWKIQNCRNIDGIERKLALFEPPIDPELLARAAAAGLDIAAAVELADSGGAPPRHRFRFLANQALDLAGEARSLGQALLAALEKRDAESLAAMRAEHEKNLLDRAKDVRQLQVDEATASLEALEASRATAFARVVHYRRLLGEGDAKEAELKKVVSEDGAPFLDPRADTKTHSSKVFRMFADVIGAVGGSDVTPGEGLAGLPVNDYEEFELALGLVSQAMQATASAIDMFGGTGHMIPDWHMAPMGVGYTWGGGNAGPAASSVASATRALGAVASYAAGVSGKAGQLAARADDWIFQHNQALREIISTNRQILAAEVRLRITEREQTNHELQLEESSLVEDAIKTKDTNFDHYAWMEGRLTELHSNMYDLAFDWARRAERAAQSELCSKDFSYIRYGQWVDGKKGLLAGEALASDIRRLRMAYEDMDAREEEMTKHVSLARIDPEALVRLRETGTAEFRIPEAMFDLDVPGQYLRRIRSIAVSIPCVAGPYTGIHCRLTLLRSSIRASTRLPEPEGYARKRDGDDSRFKDIRGQAEGIVTSSAREDAGLFQTQDPADQRRMPFEGAGAISEWRVRLPEAMPSFDYSTISDLILHIRYTARNGGDEFRAKVETELAEALNGMQTAFGEDGLARMFSLKHEAPDAWSCFVNASTGKAPEIELPIRSDRLPYFVGDRPIEISKLVVFPRLCASGTSKYYGNDKLFGKIWTPDADAQGKELTFNPWLRPVMRGFWEGSAKPSQPGAGQGQSWRLVLAGSEDLQQSILPGELDDLYVLMNYRFV